MNNQNVSFYDSIHDYVKGTSMAAVALWVSVAILVIGANNFFEDAYSSYIGVQQIEQSFGIKAVSWQGTYIGMSIFLQVITVIFGMAYFSNKKRYWWAIYASFATQVADFIIDMWYRANGTWTAKSAIASFTLTFMFFTLGSEVAVTIGLGLVTRLMVEGLAQTGIIIRNLIAGIGKLAKVLSSGEVDGKGATHTNITHGFQDVKHQGGNQNQNHGGGKPQGNLNNPNQKPNWKPQQGGGGDNKPNPPKVETDSVDPDTLRRLFSGNLNSDGTPRSERRGGNPFQGNNKGH